ncbi:uncharacterized protein LOC129364001 isoform X3 [Poeciliopsis prolifica]|uniref:uncharacterized protein LOC129364001 isoform X3 n=1 Tax=Poeciliopsis prolifica TaxID=188132 RepID=UPI0024131AE3|nr:uncharacterized protein LOC129364001 isoform X3 [Poeciliopsis prolifica]XP_054892328.1 uncharacterized protein LOC129364001 isoform X3 [Poeciliopsis prolifica]
MVCVLRDGILLTLLATKVKTLPLFDRMSNMAPFLSRKFLGSVTRESWIQQPSSGAPFPCYRAQTHLLLAPPFLVFSPFTSQCFLPEVSEYRLGLSDTTPAGNFRYLTTSRMLITRGERQQMNQNLTAFCFSSAIMVAELEDFLLKILSLRGPGPLQTFLTFWKLLRLRRFYF